MNKLCTWALAGAALFAAGAAHATNCSNAEFKRLQFESSDTGAILWQSQRSDSPLDSNTSRLVLTVLFQDYAGSPFGADYAAAYSNCSGIEGKLVTQVKNLSFEFMNETGQPVHVGGGSPRYSVLISTDGNNSWDPFTEPAAFLAAVHCNTPLGGDPTWSRADFTGQTAAGCSIFVGAEQFTSDGSTSAWGLMAAAHPTWKAVSAFLIADEDGTAYVDRVAFQNKMYVQSGTGSAAIKNCSTEASC